MAAMTTPQAETLAIAYGGAATHGAIYTTAPTQTTAGTEPSGGSPAYARKALSWTAGGSDGVVTATATFDVPTGVTIVGAGVHTALTAGNFLHGVTVTSQAFASQGTYAVTFTYTQS